MYKTNSAIRTNYYLPDTCDYTATHKLFLTYRICGKYRPLSRMRRGQILDMLAVTQTGPGGPEVLQLSKRPIPDIQPHQVLIHVVYAGINRHDCNQRNRGTPPPGATDILGLEVSGVVTRVGAEADPDLLGRRVSALTNGGGYAEYCVADADLVFNVQCCSANL